MNKLEKKRGQYGKSALIAALHYVIMLGIILLYMIYVDPSGWILYIPQNLNMLLFMVLCIFLLYVAVFGYYSFENFEKLASVKYMNAVYVVLELCVAISCIMGQSIHLYARPIALMGLLCLFLFSKREAIFWNFIIAIMLFIVDTYTNYEPTMDTAISSGSDLYFSLVTSVTVGLIALFIGSKTKTRFASVMLGIPVTLLLEVIIVLLRIGQTDFFSPEMLRLFGYGAIGGMSSVVFFVALLPIFEKIFNIPTTYRIRELTSSNAPLMRKLKEEASGTFNHSLVVAQISEMCAAALGEDSELARAVALYHDMGKLSRPECFTENQAGYNLHDELSPELSADIIRSHAREGYELILKHKLPKIFADVAVQHHGTLPIKYFYYKAQKMTDGVVKIEDFSYPGPKPDSKLAAIVMIADASEAASRAITNRSVENVEKIVREIIEERLDLGQFTDCDITIKDLDTIKKTIVSSLTGVYHHRVKYPAIKFGREDRIEKGNNL
ncbi:MAG: HD domain-containing protein [Clostridia bacterium]|nr:HD domain-containing protein [Clostridia bacterium]